jgi:chromosome segregation ATPase
MKSTEEITESDTNLMLKLFSIVEIERLRNTITEKTEEAEILASQNNNLTLKNQKFEFDLQEIPHLKKHISAYENEVKQLLGDRDQLKASITQISLKEGSNKATSERIKYLERQLDFTTNENKNLNEKIMKLLGEIDEWAEKNHAIACDNTSLTNQNHLSERKVQDLQNENSRLAERREKLLNELQTLKEQQLKWHDEITKYDSMNNAIVVYQTDISELKMQ